MGRRAILGILLICLSGTAFAHRMDEYLQATLIQVGDDRAELKLRLVPGESISKTILSDIDDNGDGTLDLTEQRAYVYAVQKNLNVTLDDKALETSIIKFDFPDVEAMKSGIGEIRIDLLATFAPKEGVRVFSAFTQGMAPNSIYMVNALQPINSNIHILSQDRTENQSSYKLRFEVDSVGAPISAKPSYLADKQFSNFFHLGLKHIAEGADHLLFLLVLLLPAPLFASLSRWSGALSIRKSVMNIAKVVSAFTIGHSITLALAASTAALIPSQIVEILIASSVLLCAVHASRPLFPARESWIALLFGLIHGMAFGSTLISLEIPGTELLVPLLAFNLGIEAMQLLVIALIFPSLLLLSRTSFYPAFRILGAAIAGIAACYWIWERVSPKSSTTNFWGTFDARNGWPLALALLGLSFCIWLGNRYYLRQSRMS